MLRDVLIAAMNKGQFLVTLLALIFIIMLLKMPSEDVSVLAKNIVAGLVNGWLIGYVLCIPLAGGWFFHAKWQRRQINEDMQRMALARNKAQAKALGSGKIESTRTNKASAKKKVKKS
ncbi:MAG TPA: hypothetical protein VF544_14115 [Pyrinomonadaceae bacterium]|jgi:hypothetical protein